MSREFLNIYSQCVGNLNKNQSSIQRQVTRMVSEFATHYSDNKLCKERFVFNDKDFDSLIRMTRGTNKREFESEIKKHTSKPEWKVINQSENIVLLFLIRYFYGKKDTRNTKLVMLLLTQRLFSGVLVKYFKHGCNDMVMDYTINTLSGYFLLSKYDGDINRTLQAVSDSIYDTYEKRTITANTDEDFLYLLVVLRTSINSFTKNTAAAYYKAFNSKLYISANQTVKDGETGSDISEFTDNNANFIKVMNSMNTYINRMGMDKILVNKVARLVGIRVGIVEELFIHIVKDEKYNARLLAAIFQSFDSFNNQICTRNFVLQTVKFLNSKYDSNKVKLVSEEVLNEGIPGYKSLSSNSKSKYKRSLILLYSLYLQKANCGG